MHTFSEAARTIINLVFISHAERQERLAAEHAGRARACVRDEAFARRRRERDARVDAKRRARDAAATAKGHERAAEAHRASSERLQVRGQIFADAFCQMLDAYLAIVTGRSNPPRAAAADFDNFEDANVGNDGPFGCCPGGEPSAAAP